MSVRDRPEDQEVKSLLELAQQALDSRDFEPAVALFEQVLALQPEHAEAVHQLGAVMARDGQLEPALELLKLVSPLLSEEADLWNNMGNTLSMLKRLPQAVGAFERALALRPGHQVARGNLSQALMMMGQFEPALHYADQALPHNPDDLWLNDLRGKILTEWYRSTQSEDTRIAAAAAWRRCLELGADRDDMTYMLAALGEVPVPPATPASYVATLFDGYAKHFDEHLVGELGYRTPQLVRTMLDELGSGEPGDLLDLGCGTGLCGLTLKSLTRHMVGVDLSPGMLEQARARGLYDELLCAELTEVLAQRPASFDMVVAADVFVYIGDLSAVFAGVSHSLRPGGIFVFSLEEIAGESFALQTSRRYAHSSSYVERLAARHGMDVKGFAQGPLRMDKGQPIPGLLMAVVKQADQATTTAAVFEDPATHPPGTQAGTQGPPGLAQPVPPLRVELAPMPGPAEPAELAHRAQAAFAAGDLEQAERLFEQTLAVAPDHFYALQMLGMLSARRGDLERGLKLLGRASELRPGDAALWNNLGNTLGSLERYAEARDAYRKAVALKPDHTMARGNLAHVLFALSELEPALREVDAALAASPEQRLLHELRGKILTDWHRAEPQESRRLGAIASWRHVIALGGDRQDLTFLIAALGGEPTPASAPADYVVSVFDSYAEGFDEHLVGGLEYRTPQVLKAVIDSLGKSEAGDVLDLGCGTGLCGPLLRPNARTLVGVDLSSGMLDKARERGIYDELLCADLTQVLKERPAAFDLIVAADVFVYIGDLAAVFAATRVALRPGGRFVFSVESVEGESYVLLPSRRYAHSTRYVEQMAVDHGLSVEALALGELRKERGVPLEGYVVSLVHAQAAGA